MLMPRSIGDDYRRVRNAFGIEPRPQRAGERQDVRGKRKDGSEFPAEICLSPLQTSRGVWILAAITDITERKRIEEQRLELVAKERALASERALRETEAELARVVRALSVGELATSIAHEVNQPLAGVVTNAEAALRWLDRDEPNVQEAKESLTLIVRDGNRASSVIRRIRQFLRKDGQKTTLVDINGVVREVVTLVEDELRKRSVSLRLKLSDDLSPVQGDRIQLQQVLLNLMMNGAEAMASSAAPKELVVSSQKSGDGEILVAVRDCGVGISSQDMHRMFDAFFTTKPTGMGMGLSISRSIIEAHGGRIWPLLNEGPGLTVQFSVPAETSQRAAASDVS
jgi:C4-dicarboxylate-specific signal transduction histidine kinase